MRFLSTLLVLLACAAHAPRLAAEQRPNVVLIMTDDQGYGDLSITGNEWIKTPHMDSLARDGAWLTRFYVSPVCTPTRAHLMTGRYNYRTRAIDTYLGRAVMEPDEVTIAEMLSGAGYATGIFGKWHLGDYFPTRPNDQGFTHSLVHKGGGLRQPANPPEGERYHDPILFKDGRPVQTEGYCTDIYFDAAIDFIAEQTKAGKPFFAYVPTNAPHGPFDEPPTRELAEYFQEKFPDDKNENRANFYAMIQNVDDNIGRLLQALDDLDIAENTLVIFLSDNGPSAGSAGPFRAKKGSVYEGGIRSVCFLRWPKWIEAGATNDTLTAHLDLTPTILDACDVDAPKSVEFDGRSVLPLFIETAPQFAGWPDRNIFLQWHRGDTPKRFHHFAAIGPKGRWKLVGQGNAGRPELTKRPKFELYDLHADPSETENLAESQPEKLAELKAAYSEWFDDVSSTRSPNFGMPPIVIGANEQPTVVLTPQDKRVDGSDAGGWRAPGSWPIDVRQTGPYTIHVRLTGDAPQEVVVGVEITVGEDVLSREIVIPRGVHSAAIGNVTLPAKGTGRVVARVQGDASRQVSVYQVTIK